MKKFFRFIFRLIGGIILFLLVYFILSVCLSLIPSNSNFTACEKDAVEVFILTNGVHTDLVLPLRTEQKDWSALLDPGLTRSGDTSVKYISFGWGDKGFYLETPRWADLTFGTAFRAMFFLGSTAMHVTYYKQLDAGDRCKRVCISKEAYALLTEEILSGFQIREGAAIRIDGSAYGSNDIFYEGTGTYNLFLTCNTWANSCLKNSGMRACLWTPFDEGIFWQYREF